MTFGERLREARKASRMTQEELAYMVGVAKSTLTNYEKDRRQPFMPMVKRLSEALNVSGDYLIGNDIKKEPSTLGELTEREYAAVMYLRSLPPDAQAAMISGLEAAAEVLKAQGNRGED